VPGTSVSHALGDYLWPLRRSWWIVLLGVLLGAGGGAGAAELIDPTYTSATSVLVTPTGVQTTVDPSGSRTQGLVNLDTEAQLVRSNLVLRRVRELLGVADSPSELRGRIDVTVPANTTVLDIGVSGPSRQEAQAGARAVSRAYLGDRRASAQQLLNERIAGVDGQIASLRERLRRQAAVTASIRPGSAARSASDAQLDSYRAQMTTLGERSDALRTTVVTPGRVIGTPSLPDGPSTPIWAILVASGCMVGLLAGILAAVVRDRRDDRVRGTATLHRLGVPVVSWRDAPGSAGDDRHDGGPDVLPTHHRLCNLVFAACGTDGATIMVGDVSRDQCKLPVSAGLATGFARLGRNSALLNADGVYEPATGAIPPRPGGENASVPSPGLHPTSERQLFVGALSDSGDPDRLDVAALHERLEVMHRTLNFVVVDAPPVADAPMGQTLARSCDGSILVVECGVTRTGDLADALRDLELVGGRVIAVVAARSRTGRRGWRRPRST